MRENDQHNIIRVKGTKKKLEEKNNRAKRGEKFNTRQRKVRELTGRAYPHHPPLIHVH
jgi:hypothetical protein